MADKREGLIRPKELGQIRPATKGVKVQSKREQPVPQPAQRTRPRIVQDVRPPDIPENQLQESPEEAAHIVAQLRECKETLMDAMRAFNRLLSIRVLPENKTIKDKENEQEVVTRVTQAAMSVDELSAGEGLLAMCVLSLRQSLQLRDAGNSLAHSLKELEERVMNLESGAPQLSEEEKKKRFVEELAKKYGLDATFQERK